MKDDGYRLSFSVKGDKFSITDNLSGNAIMFQQETFTAASLDKDVALNHIKALQEAIMSYTPKCLLLNRNKIPVLSETDVLVIRENSHFNWTLSRYGDTAQLENSTLTYTRGFNTNNVLSLINKMFATLMTKDEVLHPKRDIVRRIADAGVLVWVHGKNTVIVYEKDVSGNFMANCMINGIYFPLVIVSTSIEKGRTVLLNSQWEDIITFPLDKSITAFYPADEEAFD